MYKLEAIALIAVYIAAFAVLMMDLFFWRVL